VSALLSQAAKPLFSANTALALVIANMIGVGVFTSLSFQVHALPSPAAILLLWLVGGITALCGALCYAELATALQRSGGEYAILRRALHPLVGFVAGWVSLLVGFAAPVAAAAMALAAHLSKVYPLPLPGQFLVASALLVALSCLHAWYADAGARFQRYATWFKVLLIGALASVCFALVPEPQPLVLRLDQQDMQAIFLGSGFAVSLVYVAFAYSGWNAAVYALSETQDPARSIPRALILGTLIVTLLYLVLNAGFLRAVPWAELKAVNPFALGDAGLLERELAVGFLAGRAVFGESGARVIAALVAIGLISAISAMIVAGSRVARTMAEDWPVFRLFAGGQGVARAIGLQLGISLLLLWTQSFSMVIATIGLCLSICAMAVVIALFWLRWREPALPRPFRCWGYPFTPIVFLVLDAWMCWHVAASEPKALVASALTLGAGVLAYGVLIRSRSPHTPSA